MTRTMSLQDSGGIEAPATAPEGSSVSVSAPGSKRIIVTNLNSGEEFERDVDDMGDVRFELPSNWVTDDVLTIVDKDDPSRSTGVVVTPASQ